jgi:hypothetical protein
VREAVVQPGYQACDRLRLVAGGLEAAVQPEGFVGAVDHAGANGLSQLIIIAGLRTEPFRDLRR